MGRGLVAVALVLALLAVGPAHGAPNTVPATKVARYGTAISANTLKPSSCAAITPTTLVTGITGTAGADLQLGSALVDAMSGNNGNDCILGGGGDDAIAGGNGTDVCIGGPGTDTFTGCETQLQ